MALAALALSALLLTGCSFGGSGSTSAPGGPGVEEGGVAPEVAPDIAGGEAGSDTDIKTGDRDVISTGSVSLAVEDPVNAARNAVAVVERAGGRIDSRAENPKTPNQPASASLTLRIPSDVLEATLSELRQLGTVNFVTLKKSDVTQQTEDIDARITSLRTSVDRLLGLMTQAATTTDLIAIESALSSRQQELESLQSQRELLSEQVAYATITLELQPLGTVAPGAPETFWGALAAGWNALLVALGGVVIGIGFALPWLLALGVLGAIALVAYRLVLRARRTRQAPTTPTQATTP